MLALCILNAVCIIAEEGDSLGRLEGCPLSEQLNTDLVSDLCIIIDFCASNIEKMLLFNIMNILYKHIIYEYESYCSLYNRTCCQLAFRRCAKKRDRYTAAKSFNYSLILHK